MSGCLVYKPIIMVGDIFEANSPKDAYGKSKLIITKIISGDSADAVSSPRPQPLFTKGNNELDNQWIFFKLDPEVKGIGSETQARFWWIRDYCHRLLTHDEKSVLLYAESCLVDSRGLMKSVKMNAEDMNCLKRFKMEGLIDYGRIPFHEINHPTVFSNTHWVSFSEEAWTLVHNLRRERAEVSPISYKDGED